MQTCQKEIKRTHPRLEGQNFSKFPKKAIKRTNKFRKKNKTQQRKEKKTNPPKIYKKK